MNVSRMHFCFICHTEGTPNDFERGLPAMLELRKEIEEKTGKTLNMTWALGTFHDTSQAPIFEEYNDTFKTLLSRGDEIGLHPHGVVQNGRWTVDPFIVEDTKGLCAAGFPRPKIFAAGVWAFYPSTLAILEAEGYKVDASVVAGLTRQRRVDKNGNVFYDFPPSEVYTDDLWPIPYRLSRYCVVRSGNSSVIEIPVVGHLAEFCPGNTCDIPEKFSKRYQALHARRVDVFEVFWHPSEFLVQGVWTRVDERTVGSVRDFLLTIAALENVFFSTVYDAAMDWKTETEKNS
jgi:hypothetical protein